LGALTAGIFPSFLPEPTLLRVSDLQEAIDAMPPALFRPISLLKDETAISVHSSSVFVVHQ
jgi:hypothetical protein